MRIRARVSIAIIAMIALVAAASIATRSAAQDKTLTTGVLGPLSGGAASYGVELVRGAEMKADEINKAGGLKVGNGVYHIKLVSYDHKALAADAATAANKLVFQDKVKYIIGNAVGATCNAVQTVTEPEKVLFSFVCWGTANLGPDKPYSFRAMLSQWEVAEPFYRWVKEKHPQVKRVALISPNDTSGKDTNTAVVKALKGLGFEVAADEYYERGTKDFYPILTKMLATKPDMLDVAAAPAGEGGPILKQARELGFKGAKGWTAGTNPFTIIGVAGKEAAEGVWSPTNINVKSDFVGATVRRFGEEYEKRYKEVPGVIAVANYAAFDVITKAMQDARSLETDRVLTALTQKPFDTVWGKLVLGGKDTYGIDRQFLYPMVISEIRDGKVVDIAQVLPAALKQGGSRRAEGRGRLVSIELLVQALLNGFGLAMVYVLVALGLTLIFSILEIINFAHGEFYMLGGYVTYYVYALFGLNYFATLGLAIVTVGFAGVVAERVIFHDLRGRAMNAFIVSLGLLWVMQAGAQLAFGVLDKPVPSAFSGVVRLFGLVMSVERLVVTLAAIVLIAALYLFLRWSRPGRAMRAVAQDPDAAALQGVNIDVVSALGFGVGCALAGGAGGLLAPLFAGSAARGARGVVKPFIIIRGGGMGSLRGAVLGGLLRGGVEGLGALFMGSAAVNILGFLMVIVVLLVRPGGLVGG